MKYIFLLFLLGCGRPIEPSAKPSAIKIPVPLEWLKKSSLVDESRPKECPAAKGSLYRMSSGGFFTLPDAVKNMLGDDRYEHISWRMAKILREKGIASPKDLSFERWKQIKDEALDTFLKEIAIDLRAGKSVLNQWKQKHQWENREYAIFDHDDLGKCVIFAKESETFTWQDNPLQEKEKSFGIPFATKFEFAITPTDAGDKTLMSKPGEKTIIEIKETVPRAAFTTMGRVGLSQFYRLNKRNKNWALEYYVPIVVPASDIKSTVSERFTGDIGHSHSVVKVEDDHGLKEILINKEIKRPEKGHQFGELEGKIVPCLNHDPCKSDAVDPLDIELKEIVDAAVSKPIKGNRFKYVAKKP